MKEIIIWTDGSSSGTDSGPGGYAAVICIGKDEILIGGGCSRTTNQKMELMAAIAVLEYLTEPTRVTLHTDSSYVSNCFLLGWWERWLTNGWRDSKNKPVKNRVLWERLMRLNEFHDVMWCKVKGHSADFPMNERCDRLAAAQKMLHSPETRMARPLTCPPRPPLLTVPASAALPRGSPCPPAHCAPTCLPRRLCRTPRGRICARRASPAAPASPVPTSSAALAWPRPATHDMSGAISGLINPKPPVCANDYVACRVSAWPALIIPLASP